MRVKDVELMLSNIIDWSFETVRTVREGTELLDCFRRYANRETIRRIFDMKTVQVSRRAGRVVGGTAGIAGDVDYGSRNLCLAYVLDGIYVVPGT